jgi:hypothetical protein
MHCQQDLALVGLLLDSPGLARSLDDRLSTFAGSASCGRNSLGGDGRSGNVLARHLW